jgi:hypothetical protein
MRRLKESSGEGMVNPEATYDSLFIVERLETSLHGVTEGETHLFAYLASLLGLFQGAPLAEWGYKFTRTNWGAPFSREIAEALEELTFSSQLRIESQDAVAPMACTEEGKALAAALDELELCRARRPFLEAACSSAGALPVSAIRQAIRSEPTLKSATGHAGPQELLAGPSLELLYEQFGALRAVLGDAVSDLLVPSSVWLSYLIETSSNSETAA